jgi:hypothetical protein
MWPTWAKINEKDLAKYVLGKVAGRVWLEPNRDDTFKLPDGRRLVAAAIYRALVNRKIRYSAPPYNPDLAVQEIRDPLTMLDGSGNGTCLDLALLYAGAALGNELLPLVVLLKGHALVAVSTTCGQREFNAPIRKTDEGDWVAQGLLYDPNTLKRLVDEGEYFLIECTGFAASGVLLPTVPEGIGRVDGLLSFDRAVTAGREQLDRPDRTFLFAVDIAFLQHFGKVAPHEPPGWSLEALPDLRRRLTRILEDHRVFGGRDTELRRIDDFVAKTSSGYLLVTGPSGCGKTALLANWIRQRTGRGEAVAYHFINRQHQLAAHDDALRTLLQQLRYQQGHPGSSGVTESELEAAYLEWLEKPPLKPLVVVLDGLDEADGWTPGPQLFPGVLPGGLHLIVSAREIAGRDWVRELNLPLPGVIELGPLAAAGVLEVLQSAAAPEWVKAPEALDELTAKSEGDPFYLRQLVADLIPGALGKPARIRTVVDLAQQPSGLDDYLGQWWSDIQGVVKGEKSVKQILGYLLVERGRLTRDDLVGLGPSEVLDWDSVDDALKLVRRFVVGDAEHGYALSHWRFQDYLGRKKLPKASQAPYRDRLIKWCAAWQENKSIHALRFLPGYLLAVLADAGNPQPIIEQLVATLSNKTYQALRARDANDGPGLRADVIQATAAASRATRPDSLTWLVQCALELDRVEREWLQPGMAFGLARIGAAQDAERQLSLFQGEEYWREAGLLLIAWLLASISPDDARGIIRRFLSDWIGHPPLPLLRDRVRATLGDAPAPQLTLPYYPGNLPTAPSEDDIQAVLARAGGSLDFQRGTSGLLISYNISGLENSRYVTEMESPFVVAFAIAQPKGLDYLRQYIAIHAGNPYADYRNQSLWGILAAVLCIPDDSNAQELSALLAAGAYTPSPIRFREALWVAIQGKRALAAVPDARSILEQKLLQTEEKATQLKDEPWKADSWGHHCRRLAAFAEALERLGQSARAAQLLDRAAGLPFGFAGYQAPASLTLAEANLVVRPSEVTRRCEALAQAGRSAHNVQDPGFCARTTARYNALRDKWWNVPIPDLPRLIADFATNPEAPQFAPVHRIGEGFPARTSEEKLPIDYVRNATTLTVLAKDVFRLPVSALIDRNPLLDPAKILETGTEIAIPDPKFAPLLAARLAAEVLAQPSLSAETRVNLLRKLVPPALANPTALGTVLARLVLALESPPLSTLDRLLSLATPVLEDQPLWNIPTPPVWATAH